ncbi:transcription factor kayak-like [Lucilia sericata]|uniref:transcription factor kayak-like n=1 Tax=Lucilia sericata TaxID=13632 RepID=UPI0018A86F53|nr:transcription factor kayak-like [Lucilia sericata]
MDIMDIQAVESKLSDVTVTPIPRSQVQNFYNYQQQREQREQQPQIQISAIHHAPRERHSHGLTSTERDDIRVAHSSSSRDLYAHSKRERDYHQQLSQVAAAVASGNTSNAAVAAAALQYTQQLQAQLALLQQQANTTASPSITLTPANPRASVLSSTLASQLSMTPIPNTNHNNVSITSNGGGGSVSTPSQLKYPQSTSPLILGNNMASNLATAMTSSSSNLGGSAQNNSQNNGLTKYAQLLAIIEEMGRDIRPTYTGSRTSTERLKRGIVHARILVRECLMETERSARQ